MGEVVAAYPDAAEYGSEYGKYLELRRLSRAAAAKLDGLTPRERQVLEELAHGASNKQVARLLEISPRTVEIHRASMMRRLGVSSFAEALWLLFLESTFDSVAQVPESD